MGGSQMGSAFGSLPFNSGPTAIPEEFQQLMREQFQQAMMMGFNMGMSNAGMNPMNSIAANANLAPSNPFSLPSGTNGSQFSEPGILLYRHLLI